LVDNLINDMVREHPQPAIAYRNGYKWIETHEKTKVVDRPDEIKIKKDGVYVIIGGTVVVGTQISGHISSIENVKIVFISRSVFPPKDEWDIWIGEKDVENNKKIFSRLENDYQNTIDNRTDINIASKENFIKNRFEWIKNKIQRFTGIESNGTVLDFIKANVFDEEQMTKAINEIKLQFGRIDGIIHAAVSTNNETVRPLMESTGIQEMESEFVSKVYGLIVLEKIIKNEAIDFCMIFSSLSSFLGGMGLVNYTAASNFIDSYAKHINKESTFPWMSINWDHWGDEDRNRDIKVYTSTEKYTMSKEEAEAAFRLVLQNIHFNNVTICVGEMQERLDLWINKINDHKQHTTDIELEIQNDVGNIEYKITNIWKKLLGIDEISSEDIFFELGGHSLLAMQIITKIESIFGYRIPIRSFLERPTIKDIVNILETESQLTETKDTETIEI